MYVSENIMNQTETLLKVKNIMKQTEIEKSIIENLIFLLTHLSLNENINDKELSYIHDDIDHVEIRYFNNNPDGDNQERIFSENNPGMDFRDALNCLSVRYNNVLNSL